MEAYYFPIFLVFMAAIVVWFYHRSNRANERRDDARYRRMQSRAYAADRVRRASGQKSKSFNRGKTSLDPWSGFPDPFPTTQACRMRRDIGRLQRLEVHQRVIAEIGNVCRLFHADWSSRNRTPCQDGGVQRLFTYSSSAPPGVRRPSSSTSSRVNGSSSS